MGQARRPAPDLRFAGHAAKSIALEIFRKIAEACAALNVQLVLSLGGGLEPERLGALSGDPLVVNFAPQLELVKRASVVITHAGLNTVLESLAEGVPLVCIPLGNDQPGVASRVKTHGAGVVIPPRRASVARLRSAVRTVLENDSYRLAARNFRLQCPRSTGSSRLRTSSKTR